MSQADRFPITTPFATMPARGRSKRGQHGFSFDRAEKNPACNRGVNLDESISEVLLVRIDLLNKGAQPIDERAPSRRLAEQAISGHDMTTLLGSGEGD